MKYICIIKTRAHGCSVETCTGLRQAVAKEVLGLPQSDGIQQAYFIVGLQFCCCLHSKRQNLEVLPFE